MKQSLLGEIIARHKDKRLDKDFKEKKSKKHKRSSAIKKRSRRRRTPVSESSSSSSSRSSPLVSPSVSFLCEICLNLT